MNSAHHSRLISVKHRKQTVTCGWNYVKLNYSKTTDEWFQTNIRNLAEISNQFVTDGQTDGSGSIVCAQWDRANYTTMQTVSFLPSRQHSLHNSQTQIDFIFFSKLHNSAHNGITILSCASQWGHFIVSLPRVI